MTDSQNLTIKSSDLFRVFYEKTSDAILILENGIFTDCNRAAVELMHAKDKAELLSIHPSVLSPEFQPDGRPSGEKADEMIQTALEKGSNRFEWVHRRVDGEDIPIEVVLTPVCLGERDVVLTVWRDITERKQGEQALQEAEARQRQILGASPSAILLTRISDGTILYANQQCSDWLGWTHEQLMQLHAIDLYAEANDRAPVLQALQQKGNLQNYKLSFKHADGTPFPIYLSVGYIEYGGEKVLLSSFIDITQQQKAEQALHESETKLLSALRIAQMGHWEYDIPTQMFTFNDQYYSLHGRTAQEVGGYQMGVQKFAQEFVYPEDAPIVGQATQQAIETNDPNFQVQIEARIMHADGEPRWVTVWFRIEKDAQGQTIKLHGVNQDITERKRAEARVQESRTRFQELVETLNEWVWEVDQNGTYTYVSPNIRQLLGYEPEEVLGKSPFDLMPPEEAKRVVGIFGPLLSAQQPLVALENTNRHKDGHLVVLETNGKPFFDDKGKLIGYRGTDRDITERKWTEQALRDSQQLLQTVMDNIPQSIFWKDSNLTYLGCNSAFATDAGLASASDILGKNDWDMPWKGQAELYRADDSLVMQSGTPKLNYEEPQSTPDGSLIWLRTSKVPLRDESGNVYAVLGMYEDITERKRTEEALRESQGFLRTVVDNLPQSVFWKDSNLDYLGCNREFARILGLGSPMDIVGKTDWDLSSADRAEHYREDDMLVIQSGLPKHNIEEPQTRPDGSLGWLLTSKVPLRDAAGNVTGVLGMFEDITERKEQEQKRQAAFEHRGRQVELSTQFSQSIASSASLDELYERVVGQVKEQFGYYYAQILRYDPTQEAVVLVTGFGEVGAKMLAEGHRMLIGEGLIGTAAATGETVLRPILENDPDWRPNPLLPETKGEIAVPIRLGQNVLGVLDVQSNVAGALSTEDQLLLEGLCGQIATAMESTRLRQEMSERLEEISRLYQAMRREGWQAYQQSNQLPAGFMFDRMTVVPVEAANPSQESFLDIPILFPGGDEVGTLEIADDPRRPLSVPERDLLAQIAEQIALALESARLFEETQRSQMELDKRARELQSVAEISTISSRELNLEKMLETVVYLTQRRFGLYHAHIFLYNEQTEQLEIVACGWKEGDEHEGTHGTTVIPLNQDQSIVARAARERRAVVVNNVHSDPTWLPNPLLPDTRSEMAVPLMIGAQVLGVLDVQKDSVNGFTEEDVAVNSTLATQVATALQNARTFTQAQKQAEREAMLNVINQKIQSATSVEAVLQIAARELGHALGAPMTIAQLSMKDKS